MIEKLPKGAIFDTPDHRDFAAAPLLAQLPPADFSKGSGLVRPPLKDQDTSDSCVGHAWTYYQWQLEQMDFSIRDLFSRIAQSYGAVIRDGGVALVNEGQALQSEVPDPTPETPQNMRDKAGVDAAKEAVGLEVNSFMVPGDIDSVAAAIVAYKGVVFGVTGSNAGWEQRGTLTVPEPPTTAEQSTPGATWGHALYAVDFHIHEDGQKCIICVTSWPNAGITEHHIRENYFTSGNTFNPWTLIPKEQQFMVKKFRIQDGSKLGILILEGFTGTVLFADNQAHYAEICDANGVNAQTPLVQVPQ
jgi:hypothetical protein